jgi:hypothetical protein
MGSIYVGISPGYTHTRTHASTQKMIWGFIENIQSIDIVILGKLLVRQFFVAVEIERGSILVKKFDQCADP